MCAPKRSQERPGIDSKSSRNGARIPSGTALGPRRGQERPQSARTPRKSRESRAKVGPRVPEGPPRGPQKEPKIKEHREMAVAGATRERQKSRRALFVRLFRFGALPGTIVIDFGCPGTSPGIDFRSISAMIFDRFCERAGQRTPYLSTVRCTDRRMLATGIAGRSSLLDVSERAQNRNRHTSRPS